MRPRVGLAHVQRLDQVGGAEGARVRDEQERIGKCAGSSSGGTVRAGSSNTSRYSTAPSPMSVGPRTSSSAGAQTRGPLVNTSPRRASSTGVAPPYASSVDAPATGTPSANDSERAIARPMRMLVKLPGPRPTTIARSERVGDQLVDRGEQVAGRSPRRARPAQSRKRRRRTSRCQRPRSSSLVDPHAAVRLVDVPRA